MIQDENAINWRVQKKNTQQNTAHITNYEANILTDFFLFSTKQRTRAIELSILFWREDEKKLFSLDSCIHRFEGLKTGPCFVRRQKDCYEVNHFEENTLETAKKRRNETTEEKKHSEIKDEMFDDKCKFKWKAEKKTASRRNKPIRWHIRTHTYIFYGIINNLQIRLWPGACRNCKNNFLYWAKKKIYVSFGCCRCCWWFFFHLIFFSSFAPLYHLNTFSFAVFFSSPSYEKLTYTIWSHAECRMNKRNIFL